MNLKNYHLELSVIIPARNEAENLLYLLPQVHQVLTNLKISYEIIIVDEDANQETYAIVKKNSAKLIIPNSKGYGVALQAGFQEAYGAYIVTMDADLSHSPEFLTALWNARQNSDIIIASRYAKGGRAIMPRSRLALSKILNLVFSRGLDLRIRDMSSGYRLYKASILKRRRLESQDFNILQELLVSALVEGFSVLEIPFTYQPRQHGTSHARIFKFGIKYLQTFSKLWKIRNSIASADYDARAFDTFMPPQRYWQRQRYKYITNLIQNGDNCLDVGCGSSRILGALPDGSIGLDIQMRKLRYSRCYHKIYVNSSATSLPITSESMKCIICSEVVEHIPGRFVFSELDRVLSPNGLLILGTPDYSKWEWIVIEKLYKLILPQAYADEHITHYTYREIIDEFVSKRGYTIEKFHYILRSELIISLRKPIRIN
ncbi:MAG: glycosyltransferase [Anaerolineales bacterium]